jgi:hypothetical protein
MSIKFITNEQLYKQAIEPVARATSFVWIGTADIKDLHVHQKGTVHSFLAVLDSLAKRKVSIRLLHAKEPGPIFTWRGSFAPGYISNTLLLTANLHTRVPEILQEQA